MEVTGAKIYEQFAHKNLKYASKNVRYSKKLLNSIKIEKIFFFWWCVHLIFLLIFCLKMGDDDLLDFEFIELKNKYR